MVSERKRKEQREQRKKVFRYAYLAVVFLIIVYTLFINRYNLISYFSARNENKRLNDEISTLTKENEELEKQNDELKHNLDEIERVARINYNMTKEGETMILFHGE